MTRRFAPALLALAACTRGATVTTVTPEPAPAVVAAPETAVVRKPTIAFTTTEAFSATSVPAFRESYPRVYAHIDANQKQHLANLQRWVRQPSVSAQNEGIAEMAAMLRDDLKKIGFREAELVPTSGHPGVWGFYDAGAAKTLVVYMMYDVQPVEPAAWRVKPFDGAVTDHPTGRVLMARGATNQKGPERAFLNALESAIAVEGKLPVNLMVVAEGEEELGSPHYPEVIEKYAARLEKADGVIFPFNAQSREGAVDMALGVKGIVYFEMEATGNATAGGPQTAEVHSSLKAITDSPVWRLTQALASLTSPDGNTIRVAGYYDRIRQPTDEEQRLTNGMLEQWTRTEPTTRQAMNIARWSGGLTGRASLAQYLFDTSLNIDGIWGGYTGPGVKTILPHKATAKLDSRLVPDQHPDTALRLIRAHLDREGFADVVVRKLSGYPPAQSSVSAPLVQAAIGVYNKYGHTPSVSPRLAGSAPYYIFTQRLKLPMVMAGLGHGSGAHAPNEYMVIEPAAGSRIAGLADVEKFYVDLLHALAESK